MSRLETNILQYLWLLSFPLLAFSLWSEWQEFFALWKESIVYHHGYLVLAGACFVLFSRRDRFSALTISGSPLALLLLAVCSAVLLFSQAADIRFIRLMLVPVMIVLWGWSIWGAGFLQIAGGPILLLMFGVPVWDDLSPLLQHITVFFNDILLRLFNIDAIISEFFIELDVGVFHVENGCSGVRYLMVALFLAAFYGQIFYRKLSSKVLLVLFAGLLSMLSNWIRVFGIILAGHYTNMETSLVEDHELFGWGIFMIFTLMPLFFLSGRFEAFPARNTEGTLRRRPATPNKSISSWGWPAVASSLLIWPSLLPMVLEAKTERIAESWQPELVTPSPGWKGPIPHVTIWTPKYIAPDFNLSGVYVSEDLKQVQLQITGYKRQVQDKELIFFKNKLFDPEAWILLSSQKRPLPSYRGLIPPTVNETVIQNKEDASKVIVWSWYELGGYLTDSRLEAKIAGAIKKLSGDNRGALWALAGPCGTESKLTCEHQRDVFQRFMQSSLQ
ncbi:exosortase A [Marinobacter sp. F4216]|uniref:exosortase A n=1 Tax=Marinobacter sp. F4216 TaxID=2874281 RepID=UPI001CBB1107|nr:exosortase A [Marinobacter sp. F4216]MBZ2167875.1 EpsI family protein [Marinobacter sp. F4216]